MVLHSLTSFAIQRLEFWSLKYEAGIIFSLHGLACVWMLETAVHVITLTKPACFLGNRNSKKLINQAHVKVVMASQTTIWWSLWCSSGISFILKILDEGMQYISHFYVGTPRYIALECGCEWMIDFFFPMKQSLDSTKIALIAMHAKLLQYFESHVSNVRYLMVVVVKEDRLFVHAKDYLIVKAMYLMYSMCMDHRC